MDNVPTNGFSLSELLILLVILSLVFCFMTPSLSSWYHKNQMDVAVDDIKGAIRFAKREVWLSNAPLILGPSLDGKNWSKGIQLWEDDGTHANSLTVTHHYEWHLKGVHITWHGFQANDYLLFTRELSQNTLNGYFVIENDTGKRVLVVNRLGRVREKF